MVEAQISPFLSKFARYGYVRGGKSYSVNFSDRVSNTATFVAAVFGHRDAVWSSMFMRRGAGVRVGSGHHVTFVPSWRRSCRGGPAWNSAIHRLFCESEIT